VFEDHVAWHVCLQAIGDLGTKNIKLVGTIPSGLPSFTGSWWTPINDPSVADLMPIAIVVMFVDLLESTSIARAMARKNG
jgi:sulfate transporter 4